MTWRKDAMEFVDKLAAVVYSVEDALGQSHLFWFAFGWAVAAFLYN